VEDVNVSAGPSRAHAGRVLGIDLGSVRIGIALSDPTRTVASPHSVLPRSRDHASDHRAILELVRAEEVTAIVVGLPLSLSGATGPAARAAEAEMVVLRTVVGPGIEVLAHDERLTTITAERSLGNARMTRLQRRAVVDKVAAAVMLQSWLDRSPIATRPSGKTRR
jgi:putative Holliday junction resolvase